MKIPPTRRWSTVLLWISIAVNLCATGLSLATRVWWLAGFQSAFVACLATWAWLLPRVDAWSAAGVGEAETKYETAKVVLTQMQRVSQSGSPIRVRVDMPDARRGSMN
jgi:hypothetical protein